MSTHESNTQSNEGKSDDLFEYTQRCLKVIMLEELEKHDWIEEMRLKCKAYIKNNGTKITTVDEVVDFLKEDALKSFPKNVSSICEDAVKDMIESINNQ